jgi:uncharacterized protein YbjT (DUF2867 family)
MRVFVAGASGAIGLPLLRELAAHGHEIVAMTRTPAHVDRLRALAPGPSSPTASTGHRCGRPLWPRGPRR